MAHDHNHGFMVKATVIMNTRLTKYSTLCGKHTWTSWTDRQRT